MADRGVAPLLDELALIDAAADPVALAAVLGALQRTGVGGGDSHQPMWCPPLMSRLLPVIQPAWSSARKPTP